MSDIGVVLSQSPGAVISSTCKTSQNDNLGMIGKFVPSSVTPEIHIEPHPTAVSVKVSFPTSASHFNLTGCDVQCEGPSGFSQCEQLSLPGTNQVRIDGLCPGKQYKLKAVAKYVPTGFSEEEVSSEEQCVLIPAGGKL